MATIAPLGKYRAFDDNGDPLSGGKLYTYEAGTTTPKATFTTEGGDVSNTNPVILDSSGYADVWLGTGGYKFVLTDSDDVTIFTVDNIGGTSSSAFGAQVNSLSSNTNINTLYANSVNICTGTITLSLLEASSAESGFYFSVKNEGSGVVTIDPDASETIDGQATRIINPGESALIITDGAEWYTLFFSIAADGNNVFSGDNTFSGVNTFTGKVLTPSDGNLIISSGAITVTGAYHLVDTEASSSVDQLETINGGESGQILTLRTADDARDVVIVHNSGNILTPTGQNVSLLSTNNPVNFIYDGGKSRWLLESSALPVNLISGFSDKVLSGLILSNNAVDATNDIDASSGSCVSDDGTTLMTLSSFTKKLDESWSPGTNQGFLSTGSIADTTYHIWVINRPDTGETDLLADVSATSPTLPANYTKKKCIGSIIRASGSIVPFFQNGNRFTLVSPAITGAATNPGTSAVLRATGAPLGVKFTVDLTVMSYTGTTTQSVYVSSPDQTDSAAQPATSTPLTLPSSVSNYASGTGWTAGSVMVRTNTAAEVRTRLASSGVNDRIALITNFWVDHRI